MSCLGQENTAARHGLDGIDLAVKETSVYTHEFIEILFVYVL